MKYRHLYNPNGDNLMQNLLRIRKRMDEAWTENMAAYALRKSCRIPGTAWREPCRDGVPYTKLTFTEV